MLKTTTAIAIWMAAVLALGTVAIAQNQNPGVSERFTFKLANATNLPPTSTSNESRLEILVDQWSNDADRDRLLSVLKDEGSENLTKAFWNGPAAGHLYWPGNLEYTIRFAHRMPASDGGEDIVLATDYPISLWWDSSMPAPKTFDHGTVIQLHLNKDGRGEGKLALNSRLTASKDGKSFVIEDYGKQPVVMADVQRARGSSNTQ
jgi:hypothetical protein